MHDFQRDAQWATSQNPGLRLTGDSSLHECFGCHFIPAAFLFFRGSRTVVPVHDHLQLVVPGPAPAGVVVLAHNIRCQICLSVEISSLSSPHVNMSISNHSTTRKSWRSDAPIILPGWECHTGGSRSKPTVHRCRPKTGGCGLLTRTQDEPTKTTW